MSEPQVMNQHDLDKVDWFHGSITRQVAEALVRNSGEFLVRESIAKPGSYVLTCQSGDQNQALHFVINDFIKRGGRTTEKLYGFEDERYPSVQALISCHIVERKPITAASRALISKPVSKTVDKKRILSYTVSNAETGYQDYEAMAVRNPARKGLSYQLPNRSVEVSKSATSHSVVTIRNRELYDDGPDYSDYDEVKRAPTDARIQSQTDAGPTMDYDIPQSQPIEITDFILPQVPKNYINPVSYTSDVIKSYNKPLDPDCMFKMKEALFQNHHKLIAQHITYLDLHMLRVTEKQNLGAGITSGLEAFTLPQGSHFRQAALERECCVRFLVAVSILACTDLLSERVQMVKTWILVAAELLRNCGNVFGFMSIMQGLHHPSISRLEQTWKVVEEQEFGVYQIWKSKLIHTQQEVESAGSSLMVENISIPYITPICRLLEEEQYAGESNSQEQLEIMLSHLDLARLITGNVNEYSKKGKSILQFFSPKPELRDLCKVEVHMRLLYGHKGSQARRQERQVKFLQILNILSQRAENHDNLL